MSSFILYLYYKGKTVPKYGQPFAMVGISPLERFNIKETFINGGQVSHLQGNSAFGKVNIEAKVHKRRDL